MSRRELIKTIREINKFCDNQSLLVVGEKGIFRLKCPFDVMCIQSIAIYDVGDVLTVVSVGVSEQLKLVYVIEGEGYYHWFFVILPT